MIHQSGQFKKPGEIPDGSFLNHFPRFQGEMFYENMKLVKAVEDLAADKGRSAGQVAIGWILAHTGKKDMPQIIPIPGATTAERVKENMDPAQLSEEDMAALFEILKKFPVHGDRYHAEGMKFVGN
jgi:pyridoxine 4-dehydrogenase